MKVATRVTRVAGRPARCRVVPPARPGPAATPLRHPLLLLHGLGCAAAVWERALRRLADHNLACGVVAPDLPGYGRSPGPPEALGVDALADWTAELLDALEMTRVHVVGNSLGCQVALALARRHPARVGSLVLVGPTLGGGIVPTWRYVLGLLADAPREPVVYNGTILRMYLQMGPRRFAATVPLMMADDTLAGARSVLAPCLVMRGGGDAIVSGESARRLAAALPGGTFSQIAGTAHAVQFNRPDSLVQGALGFLAGTEARHGD